MALLEEWIKDEVIRFLEVESLPIANDLKHSKYYLYDRKRGHSLEQFSMTITKSMRSFLGWRYEHQ